MPYRPRVPRRTRTLLTAIAAGLGVLIVSAGSARQPLHAQQPPSAGQTAAESGPLARALLDRYLRHLSQRAAENGWRDVRRGRPRPGGSPP